jgi:PAS domain S-box-containing protein
MARILLLVDHKENRRLLGEWLARRYEVTSGESVEELDSVFDLAIADGPALDRLWKNMSARKRAELPCFLPLLLITSRQDVGLITRQLWQSIDELILSPIEKAELLARVEILLRARGCSLDLRERNIQLEKAVNQRIQAEEALRASERHYRELAEAMPLFVWTTQPDGYVDYANRRWLSYSGMTMEQTQGWAWQSAVHPEDRQLCLDRWKEALNTGESYEIETRFRRADGNYRWHLSQTLPIRTEEGHILRWIRTSTDIDDRRQATESLRFLVESSGLLASSLDYETVLNNLARIVVPRLADNFVVDLLQEDDTLRRVTIAADDPEVEEAIRELTDRYPRDPRKAVIWPAVLSGKPLLIADAPQEAYKAASVDPEHEALARRIGTKSLLSLPLIARDGVIGTMSMGVGPSGRRYSERDLPVAELLARRVAMAIENARLYEASKESTRSREEFLAVTAHELKTPVATIRKLAQTSLEQLDSATDLARVRQSLQTIDQQAETLTRLVSQLRDISRIESGQFNLDRKLVDLSRLVESVVLAEQVTAEQHAITVHAPEPVSAWVDPLRLRQVLTNLIDNAMKYSPAGGKIDVEISQPNAEQAYIAVVDQGPGIPADQRDRIFERFYRARSGDYVGGMGLGLYISRQIVELHGGHIEAEFPPEGGSRFLVTLPVNSGPESADQPKPDLELG